MPAGAGVAGGAPFGYAYAMAALPRRTAPRQLAGDRARRGGAPGPVGVDELRAGLPAD